ncbi:putative dynamin family protein [Botrytis fragariae]|uniref:Putative dynamin family protein n=1 Tax=Botrytis fragariae TaxID=1964551 RepID=A0A8H6EL85_9HELO|nr:putative dynamin family protein [Botrytis fragariae]KAF5876299.1 putative dynamin family protein [Botrytis fragariae]
MARKTAKLFRNNGLSSLCSEDQIKIMDTIDNLRSQGINHYISLPQIIVCGDQSSGKSSVLEAISGVPFPIKGNLCTRFPTELILRRTPDVGARVKIVPYHSSSEAERTSLSEFDQELDDSGGLTKLIEDAGAAMSTHENGKAFFKHLLRVEISGPDRPHLTIVDLPGLIHSETKQQSASDIEVVQSTVQSYMKEPRSIILAVISAKNDYANQIVLKLARTADRDGTRTLGVITKPDTLVAGAESENHYATLAKNQDVKFSLGWHVLKNMDSEIGTWPLSHRDSEEGEFFSKGIWKEFPATSLGIGHLRKRLSDVLLRQIVGELPGMIEEIQTEFENSTKRLEALGEPRTNLEQQRHYLLHISLQFQKILRLAVDGTYDDPFFGDAKSEIGYQKRLRAVLQNLNLSFANKINYEGHRYYITDNAPKKKKNNDSDDESNTTISITKDQFINKIEDLMKRTRGRELPGSFNSLIITDLFRLQSTPWEAITQNHIREVLSNTRTFIQTLSSSIADSSTSEALFSRILEPALDGLSKNLQSKVAELLKPHQQGHPITYSQDPDLSLSSTRRQRLEIEFKNITQKFFDGSDIASVYMNSYRDLRPLITQLVNEAEPNMTRPECYDALVALKRFVDDLAVEAIEDTLVSHLHAVFPPLSVISMDDTLVTDVSGEAESNRSQREQLTKKLELLKKGLEICKHFTSGGFM